MPPAGLLGCLMREPLSLACQIPNDVTQDT
jgi:hypothetical protein